jgi:hypothetical protein
MSHAAIEKYRKVLDATERLRIVTIGAHHRKVLDAG